MLDKVQLRPVEKYELKDLKDLLEPYLPENVAVHNVVSMMHAGLLPATKAFLPVPPSKPHVVILSYLEWQQSQPIQDHTYLFCCLESDLKLLEDCLRTLDWSKRMTFGAVPRSLWDTIEKISQEMGASYKLESHVEKLEYVWERGLALTWDGRIPDDLEIKPLSIEHAEIINDRWKYKGPNTLTRIKDIAKSACGFGIFNKTSDELVGWYVMHSHGSQGILHVTEPHRGRGLASLLVRWVSRRVAAAWGLLPYAIIDENNPASFTLFAKIGFRRLGSCQWIVCTPAAESAS
ncbi:unnamed protein product [Darwinula stevensoni]|uniref:N-acetyltransferase domain-containing protein n=1 Tax=Darwinula stevensoni TaxID=69355 RepID=A0A7R9AGZ8_9CRUS|nr:unnamed protein product [Darwinula stevensoni]CAG0904204.1 unnamed protein product [Darwinula stevensoni]